MYMMNRFLQGTGVAGLILVLLLASFAGGHPAAAQISTTSGSTAQNFDRQGVPVLLRADQISHDHDLGLIVARGNVEIARGEHVILADTLSYNQNAKTITASSNVQILEPDGEVIFADYIELSEDFLEGTIENLKILLADNTRIAAAGGRRSDGTRTEMAKAVFSPCKICEENPEADPLWQVKAGRVIHDTESHQIEYHNALMEFYGVPVLYLPYFKHPDPKVKRQTGFLAPSYGSSETTGLFVRTPFFWNIDDTQDITWHPIFTEEQGIIYNGEYRRAYDTGFLDLSASLTVDDKETGSQSVVDTREDEIRGHIKTQGQFHLDNTWRWGWDINRATDRTYFRRFPFWEHPGNSATSRIYTEGFRYRNYASVEGFSFQDLRLGNQSDTPLTLPLLNYNGFGEADSFGGRWSLDANFQGLFDSDDADSQRLSVSAGYAKEFISPWGLLTNLSGNLRGDIYNIDHFKDRDDFGNPVDDGIAGRLIPRLSAEMRYPMARYSINGRQIIEPVVALHAAPNGGNPEDIVNADSLVFETDDTNVLTANRLTGLDRVETGQKLVGGLNMAHYGDDVGVLSMFLGHSYRFSEDGDLKDQLLLENQHSDWVGRLKISPNQYADAYYRFNFKSDELLANRSELGASVGGAALKTNVRYTFIRESLAQASTGIEELNLSLSSKLNDYWTLNGSTLQDLEEDGGSLKHRLGMIYEDECFIFNGSYLRTFTKSADVSQENSLLFQLTFKHFGEVAF